MTVFCQKHADYKSGALPTELSRHICVSLEKPPFAPIRTPIERQAGSEQSGKVGHIAAQSRHNPCHSLSTPGTNAGRGN